MFRRVLGLLSLGLDLLYRLIEQSQLLLHFTQSLLSITQLVLTLGQTFSQVFNFVVSLIQLPSERLGSLRTGVIFTPEIL